MTYQRPQIHSWNSHLLLLEKFAVPGVLGPGAIYELGMGDGSTPFFNWWARRDNRMIGSFDNNPEYFHKATSLCGSYPWHVFGLVTEWDNTIEAIRQTGYTFGPASHALIFIDHAPGERRAADIERLADAAPYIVVHDTEAACYGYEPVLSQFAYRYDHKEHPTWTTVVSNHNDLERLRR